MVRFVVMWSCEVCEGWCTLPLWDEAAQDAAHYHADWHRQRGDRVPIIALYEPAAGLPPSVRRLLR
ncbi:MAG: hypothetical protein ACRDGM_04735 [bacterium]